MVPSTLALQLAHCIREDHLGRRRLASRVGLSEMTVRIELDRMRDAGWITMNRTGVGLTKHGERTFEPLLEPIRSVQPLDMLSLRTGPLTWSAHIRSRPVPSAWSLRDEAIRKGASGCVLLIFQSGEWAFTHNAEPVRMHNPGDANRIEHQVADPFQGDLLVLVSAETDGIASAALWSVIRALEVH